MNAQNVIRKNVNEILSIPSTIDGKFRNNLWTTIAKDNVEDLNIRLLENNMVEVEGLALDPLSTALKALEPAFSGGFKKDTLKEIATHLNLGFANQAQFKASKSSDSEKKVETLIANNQTGRTADDFRLDTIKANIGKSIPGFAAALVSFSELKDSDRTKVKLEKILNDLFNSVFSEENQETYKNRVKTELEDREAFKGLYDLGLDKVSKVSEKTLWATGELSKEAMAKVTQGIAVLGWVVFATEPNMADFTVKYILNRIPETSEDIPEQSGETSGETSGQDLK